MSLKTKALLTLVASMVAMSAPTMAQEPGTSKRVALQAVEQTSEITFHKVNVSYEVMPMSDAAITKMLKSLSHLGKTQHYQLRQGRDL